MTFVYPIQYKVELNLKESVHQSYEKKCFSLVLISVRYMYLRFLPLPHTNDVNCIGITLISKNGPYSQIVMTRKTVLKLKIKDFLDIFLTEFSHKLHTNFTTFSGQLQQNINMILVA